VISGARQARPSFVRRLVARAQARELAAFVVPGLEIARALGVDLEAAGLWISDTPRHASVLLLVGELPPGLKKAAAVTYAQMPRPRAILAVGTGDVSPLPEPNVSVEPRQEDVGGGVAELRRLFAQGAFSREAADFDVDVIRIQTEYVCPMHPEVVRSEPGSCPICGMELVPREAAGGHDHGAMDQAGHGAHHEAVDNGGQGHPDVNQGSHGHHDRHDTDGSHGHMTHSEAEHPSAAHGDREKDRDEGHEGMDHGQKDGRDQGRRDREGASHDEDDHADHGSMAHASPDGHEMDHEERDSHGEQEGHDQHAGMEHGEHEGHEHTEHGGHGGHDHGGHGHMNHDDMGFMSMVEMTKDLPRSSDGLQMEWVEDVPFGPLFPGLPGGLTLRLTLDGDAVARAEAEGVDRRTAAEDLAGPAEELVDRLVRLDPLSPVAYRVVALRALESSSGVEPDERAALARVGALERERAVSHLGWLSIFGRLLGYSWLEDRAGGLQIALVRATNADEVARLWVEAGRLSRRVGKTPLLGRKLRGVGRLPEGAEPLGPVARGGGVATDARTGEEVYRTLSFEPVVHVGNDALSRLTVRLAEIEQSLDLIQKVGEMTVPEPATNGEPSGEGSATVETPRGTATLRLASREGVLGIVELEEPSGRHLGLVGVLAEQRELADALVGVASLDLSPWGATR
jgi:Ni,Fe-hydrogenase III large subunit